MYARNSHSYTHLILALGIVREPTLWWFITSNFPGIHDIGLPTLWYSRMFLVKSRTERVRPTSPLLRLITSHFSGVHTTALPQPATYHVTIPPQDSPRHAQHPPLFAFQRAKALQIYKI